MIRKDKYMLNVAFCDDDELFLKKIVPIVENEFKKRKIKVDSSLFKSGETLVQAFKIRKPYFDIIFLDIDMPYKNGKMIAKELRTIDKKFILIFITDYEQEALNMFQYEVLGFLPKDKLQLYLGDTIARAIEKIEEERPRMQIFHVYDMLERVVEIKIPLNDIKYIESIQRKIYVHSVSESYRLYHYQYTDLADVYIQMGFMDIHRTCIVNPKFVVKIGDTSVWLDDGEQLPMSRRKRKQVLDCFVENIYEGVAK